jgi:polyhydroxyalkanoate synthesis regulator phasin
MNKHEIMPLILAGDGYQLTISDEATARKSALLGKSAEVVDVKSNLESSVAQFNTRSLAAMRIEVEKSRKLIKEPVNRIGKLIDQAAAEFIAEIVAEENRIKQLIGAHAEEVMRIKAEKEAIERAAFDAARAAREAAETGGIATLLASKKALAEKLAASGALAATKLSDGVRFAWDFEVESMETVWEKAPAFVAMEIKRSVVMAWIREAESAGEDIAARAASFGIRAFQRPVISTR